MEPTIINYWVESRSDSPRSMTIGVIDSNGQTSMGDVRFVRRPSGGVVIGEVRFKHPGTHFVSSVYVWIYGSRVLLSKHVRDDGNISNTIGERIDPPTAPVVPPEKKIEIVPFGTMYSPFYRVYEFTGTIQWEAVTPAGEVLKKGETEAWMGIYPPCEDRDYILRVKPKGVAHWHVQLQVSGKFEYPEEY